MHITFLVSVFTDRITTVQTDRNDLDHLHVDRPEGRVVVKNANPLTKMSEDLHLIIFLKEKSIPRTKKPPIRVIL